MYELLQEPIVQLEHPTTLQTKPEQLFGRIQTDFIDPIIHEPEEHQQPNRRQRQDLHIRIRIRPTKFL